MTSSPSTRTRPAPEPALGTPAAYCDVVVAENHWDSVLRRHTEHVRARVTSSLHDLHELLLS
jgi:hypothetical protein